MTKDTCYFCNRTAFGTKVITVDADVCHDGDSWFVTPIKEEVGLCQEHLEGVEDEKD